MKLRRLAIAQLAAIGLLWFSVIPANALDSDGDGFTDDQEHLLETDPTDAESVPGLLLQSSTLEPGQSWDTGDAWSDRNQPARDQHYFIGELAPILRTPKTANPAFGGASLTLMDSEAELILDQERGVATIPQMRAIGGAVVHSNENQLGLHSAITINGTLTIRLGKKASRLELDGKLIGHVHWAVLAHNLWVLARLRLNQQRAEREREQDQSRRRA